MSGRAYPGGHFNISAFRITHYKPPLLFQNLVPLLLGTTLPRLTLLRELYNLELWRALCLHFATVVCTPEQIMTTLISIHWVLFTSLTKSDSKHTVS